MLSRSAGAWLATPVTSASLPLEIRILGELEAEADGRTLELGGRKQRAVLAALLLRVGEVVADERLIDDVWGEAPPASAAHTVEAYVSRLRRELAPHGVTLERRGGGYRLGLGAAVLDAQAFKELVSNAAVALERREQSLAASLAAEALGLWTGSVLAGIPLHHDGRVRAERLEEQRARALELRVDAQLALGRHTEVVGELWQAVEASPYRQQLVARLMVALYRSGRHVEALDVYERTRRTLDADLGLQPSEELQRLAGQIVRQEPQLRAPAPNVDPGSTTRPPVARVAAVAIVAGLAAAVVVAAFAFVVATDARVVSDGGPARVALIRMWNPGGPGGDDEAGWRPFVDGLIAAERRHGVETEFVDLFPRRPPLGGNAPGSYADVRRLSARLEAGDFDLVIWPLGLTGPNFWEVVPENPDTSFVYLDFCCVAPELAGAPNVTTITPRGEQSAHLAGYLAGLVVKRQPSVLGRRPAVSMVLGADDFDQEQAWEHGFAKGVRRALPGVRIIRGYTYEWDDRSICESVANRQIDQGSTVVFASSGECGLGALATAGLRGVWAVGASEDRSHLGPHVLASATKRYDRLTELSVTWFLEGRLPGGEDLELGLVDDAVALVGIHPDVPPDIRRLVAEEAARLRSEETRRS